METIVCDSCEGHGIKNYICNYCNGSGEGLVDRTRCVICKGHGEIYDQCDECKGSGEVNVK